MTKEADFKQRGKKGLSNVIWVVVGFLVFVMIFALLGSKKGTVLK